MLSPSEVTAFSLCAGPCTIHDLPTQLVHEVGRNLDVKSQQNLFLSSAQLYSQWHLHIPETHHDWINLDWGLNVLAHVPSESCRLAVGRVEVSLSQRLCHSLLNLTVQFSVGPENTGSDSQYDVKITRSDSVLPAVRLDLNYPEALTKDQVWRRLASAIGDWTPTVIFTSQASLSPHDLACAARQLFSLLCQRPGYLEFHTQPIQLQATGQGYLLESSHAWRVTHWEIRPNCSYWTYERNFCLHVHQTFDRLATRYTGVQLMLTESCNLSKVMEKAKSFECSTA